MEPKVSVVIPFYNGNKYLDEALDSIAVQSKRIYEVILVVDNGSEQPYYELDQFNFDIKVLYNPENANGAGVCRYYGFKAAVGDYVAFLDPDDVWVETKIETQVQAMRSQGLAFSFGSYVNFSNETDAEKRIIPSGPYSLDTFLAKDFTIGCLTVAINKNLVPEVSRNYLKRRNDYMMWYKLILYIEAKGLHWSGTEDVLGRHRLHSASLTQSKIKAAAAYWNYLGHLNLSPFKRTSSFAGYMLNTVKERLL